MVHHKEDRDISKSHRLVLGHLSSHLVFWWQLATATRQLARVQTSSKPSQDYIYDEASGSPSGPGLWPLRGQELDLFSTVSPHLVPSLPSHGICVRMISSWHMVGCQSLFVAWMNDSLWLGSHLLLSYSVSYKKEEEVKDIIELIWVFP